MYTTQKDIKLTGKQIQILSTGWKNKLSVSKIRDTLNTL